MSHQLTAHCYEQHVNPVLYKLLSSLKLDIEFAEGEGCWLTDKQGKKYLDFISGYGAVSLGHCPEAVEKAARRYFDSKAPALVQPSVLGPASRLARRLVELMPDGLRYVTFANSGAEAVEVAIKACRASTGKPGVVYAQSSFHGKTLGALSATGSPKYQAAFFAPVPHFHSVPYGELGSLRALLSEIGPTVACVILEPIQGEGGVVVPPPGYLAGVRKLCDQFNILMILDEVQTGLGRTGSLFAMEQEAVVPDCVTLSKALGGGVVPIGCAIMNERTYSHDFAIGHSSTFAGGGLACEIALAVLDTLTDETLSPLNNVRTRGKQLWLGLKSLQTMFPDVVRSVRGKGLMLGVEIRYEARSRFGAILEALSEQGSLIPLVSSYLLNVHAIRTAPTLSSGHVLRIQPALIVSETECSMFLDAIEVALRHISRGDTAALVYHLIHDSNQQFGECAWSSPEPELDLNMPAPRPYDKRAAFLIHPVDPQSMIGFDQSLRRFDEHVVRKLGAVTGDLLEPFVAGQTRIETPESSVYMEFICVPKQPEALLALSQAEANAEIGRAVQLCRDRGAKIVGLGAYTSVVTRGGATVTGLGTAITSGNTYTVVTGLLAIIYAANRTGLDLRSASVVIVGATGMIGSSLVDFLFGQVDRMAIIGNPARAAVTRRRLLKILESIFAALAGREKNPASLRRDVRALQMYQDKKYEDLAKEIVEGQMDVDIVCDVDPNPYLGSADIVICATNSTDVLVDVEKLKRGAIVLDLSRPSNVERSAVDRRPDVLFINGGVVAFPGKPDLGIDCGFPKGHGFACMAETAMLALAGHFVDTSIGARIDKDSYDFVMALAERFEFELAGLHSFNHNIGETDWQALRTACDTVAPTRPDIGAPDEAWASSPAVCSLPGGIRDNLTNWLLQRHVERRKDKIALLEPETGQKVTYGDLWWRVARIARRLELAGISLNSRVVILNRDSIDSVAAMLGCWWNGAVAANINPGLPAADYSSMLATLAPEMVLYGEKERDVALAIGNLGYRVDPIERWTREADGWPEVDPDFSPVALDLNAPAVCMFSSGSSGRPNAFLHSHRDFITMNLNYVPTVIGLKEGECVFSPSRMFFAYGLNTVTIGLFVGGEVVLAPRPGKHVRMLEIIEKHRVNVVFCVPTVLKLMLDQQYEAVSGLGDLRLCISAGEPLPPSLYRAASNRLGVEILDGIGTTEVLSTFISNRIGESFPGCTGLVMPGFDVRIVADRGEPCKIGETGVAWVRGNTVAAGAIGAPTLSFTVFRDAWFNTNDLFYMDANRRFYYVGRKNDVLKINGCWVSPGQIESVLCMHKEIAECAVVAVEDDYGLIRPKAIVVMRSEMADTTKLWRELKFLSKRHLGNDQYPHVFESAKALPRTASGKLQRAKLRETENHN